MGKFDQRLLTPERVQAYLREHVDTSAVLTSMEPLGATTQEGLKAYGYGRPLRVRFSTKDAAGETLVLRTMSPDPFGHDRRSDRIAVLYESFDTFARMPRHIEPIDIGMIDSAGKLVPAGAGEPFLVTTYVPGELYAHDLVAEAGADHASELAVARARALALYLAQVHANEASPRAYERDIRDTVGSGEGIFGLCDSYPPDDKVAPPGRLERLEKLAVAWRWRIKRRDLRHRSCWTHGDFHPFNILFRDGTDFSVLDCSRGGAGEPADDITCLTVNYLFWALRARGQFDGAMRELWDVAWVTYLHASEDDEVVDVVAPFFLWRALVLASPVWYPEVAEPVRRELLDFVERLLVGEAFRPEAPAGL